MRSLTTYLLGLAVVAAMWLIAEPGAQAAIIKVDNNTTHTTAGATWNEFATPLTVATSVVDSDGNDDGVTVAYSAQWGDSSQSGHEGAFDGGVFDNAAGDYFFRNDTTGNTGTVTISGLLSSEVYTIQLIGSANGPDDRSGDYTVNGGFGDGLSPANGDDYNALTNGFNNGLIMTYSGVAPVSGDITIGLSRTTGVGGAHFNAFTIEGEFVSGTGTTTTSFQEGVSPTGAYVHDATYFRSTQPDGNQNNDPDLELTVGTTATGDVLRALLEFDISDIPASDQIDSASLILTTHSNTGLDDGGETGNPTFNIFSYGFDIDETSATWNEPDAGASDVPGGTLGSLLTSASFDVTDTGLAVTFGDTDAFRTAVASGLADDGFLRLIVAKSDESTVGTHEFARFAANSFGTLGNRPELLVTHSSSTAVPEPSTAALALLGLLGLAWFGWRRKR